MARGAEESSWLIWRRVVCVVSVSCDDSPSGHLHPSGCRLCNKWITLTGQERRNSVFVLWELHDQLSVAGTTSKIPLRVYVLSVPCINIIYLDTYSEMWSKQIKLYFGFERRHSRRRSIVCRTLLKGIPQHGQTILDGYYFHRSFVHDLHSSYTATTADNILRPSLSHSPSLCAPICQYFSNFYMKFHSSSRRYAAVIFLQRNTGVAK